MEKGLQGNVILTNGIECTVDMLVLDMKNMKAATMEELSKNLKDVADSIRDGYTAGVMRPGCIWKVEETEE